MKAKRYLLIGMILGALAGWALGFLRLPYIEKNFSFLLGFITCLVFVSSGLILLIVWNKNSLLFRLMGKDSATHAPDNSKYTHFHIWKVVAVLIVLGVLASGLIIYRQNKILKNQTQKQNLKIEEMSKFIESVRKNDQLVLVSSILGKVDDEVKNDPMRTLSDETIARIIAALNYSFKPYRYWEEDSLSKNELSPGRGQLLTGLQAMNIDSGSFSKVKSGASFSGADLRGTDLHDIDLSGADLKDADLKDANLSGAKLSGVDLRGANLWGANMNEANMNGANLKRSNLSWAKLNGVDLKLANLDGANLTSAQLRKADLRGATVRWAVSVGAMLNEANLEGVDLIGTGLMKANLSRANLTAANLGRTNLSEAIMMGAELTKTSVEEKNWLDKLNEWQVTGAKEFQRSYKVVEDTSHRYKESKYRLEKIEN